MASPLVRVRPLKVSVLLAVFFAVRLCAGANVTMVWDPSPSAGVAYYRIYYGTASRVYTGYVQVSAPNVSAEIANLVPGTTYYFAAKAADAVGNESGFSNETTYVPPNATVGPTANSFNVATAEDSPVNITLNGTSGSGNPLTYILKTLPGKGTLSGLAPNLSYTPSPNSFGSDQFTYTVSDGVGAASATVTINVASVNDAPTIDAPAGIIIAQNAGPQVVPLTGITSGAPNEADVLTVTAKSNGPSTAPDPILSYASPSGVGSLTFTPKTNAIGWVTFTITVKDSGATNNVTAKTFWVFINNLPTTDPIADVSVNEDSGPRTVAITGIGPGAANETNQVMQIWLQSSNPAVIPVPTLNYTNPNTVGSLTFTPAPNAFGSSVITVITYDNQYGNSLIRREFRVTVNPINDAPTLNPISNETITSTRMMTLSGISCGAANELQQVTIAAQSSNPAVVTATTAYAAPNANGTLTLTPVVGQSGAATITVTASDGQATITRTFTVTVSPSPSVKISGLSATATDACTMNVSWNTDASATCVVEYGATAMVNMTSAQSFGTVHSATLTNLQPGTLYYLRVKATTSGGTVTAVATASTEAFQGVGVAAESGILAGSFKITTNSAAQNGKFIAASSPNGSTASYTLNLQRGLNYRVWARIKTPIGGSSFGVIMDGVEKLVFAGDTGAANQWHWVLLTDNSNRSSAVIYPLETGSHQFVVRGATGMSLDEFVFVNDPTWQPILVNAGPTLTATRTSASTATLTWNDPSDTATSYGIDYSVDGVNFNLMTSVPAPTSSLSISNLAAQTYYFRVYSFNGVDRSGNSNVAAAAY